MKEQINKLALQAREHADSLLRKKLPDMVWQDEYNKKLVELIVQECAECVTTGTYDATPPYDVLIPVLLNELAKGMKKHFGVE